MKKNKFIIYVLLVISFFSLNNLIVKAEEKGIPYINPKWEEYMELSDEEKKTYNIAPEKYIVDYVDTSGNSTPFNTYGNMTGALPSYFNLRDSYATEVYDQGQAGLCWAYTTATTIESHLKRTKGININMSVKQMDYATYSKGWVNQSNFTEFVNPYASKYLLGSTIYIRSLTSGWFSDTSYYPYLATGVSAMRESDFGIDNDNSLYSEPMPSTTIYNDDNIEYQVTEYVDFPNYDKSTAMINLMKNQIYNYGGLYIDSIAPDYRSGSCWDSTNKMIVEKATCSGATVEGRHAMTIIGWDDSYGGTGAFILQNSWGEGYEETYPRVSYQSIINHAHGIKTMVPKTWDNNYDFTTDPLVYKTDSSGNSTIYDELFINYDETVNQRIDIIFDKSPTSNEKLHSINFESDVQNGTFDVYISNTGKYEDLIKYDTVTSELPGLITIDFQSDNISVNGGYFMVSIVPKTTGSYFSPLINAFTTDATTTTTPSVTPHGDLEYYKPYDGLYNGGYGIYDFETYTNNIPDGNKLTYKIYNSSNTLITQSTSSMIIYTREIFNNSQKSRLMINNNATSGIYRVDIYNGSTKLDSFNVNYVSDVVGGGTSSNPYIITKPEQLDNIRTNLYAYYKLGSNIDMTSSTKNSSGKFYNNGLGFEPIYEFEGQLDGAGYTIKGLYINRPSEDYVGLFSESDRSYIHNLKIDSFDITGNNYVGTLYGYLGYKYNDSYPISDITITGSVLNGNNYVGGLIGDNNYSTIKNITIKNSSIHSNGTLGGIIADNASTTLSNLKAENINYSSNSGLAGGIVGLTLGDINNCYTKDSSFENTGITGGIVGQLGGTITDSYSIVDINATSYAGGIVGKNTAAKSIERLYHIGDITGNSAAGIIGNAYSGTVINDSFNVGNVNGSTVAMSGGIAFSQKGITVNRSYFIGDVTENTTYSGGGIVGVSGTNITTNINDSYYNSNAKDSISYGKTTYESTFAGRLNATNVSTKSKENLKKQSTFTNFDFVNTWEQKNTNVYPTLKSNEFLFVSDIYVEEEINMSKNSTRNITYTILPTNATITDIEFISNNEAVATVTNDGTIRAISEGTTTITANSLDKSITKEITVNVVNKKIAIKDDYAITPEIIYENTSGIINFNVETIAINSSDITYKVINTSTGLENNLVTITKNNESIEGTKTIINLTANIPSGMSIGEYKIIATNGDVTSNELIFNINDYVNVESISLNKNNITLKKGTKETLTYTITPNNAINKNVRWNSSNTSVATVNNGEITAVGRGTATITVTTIDGNKTSTANVTVTDPSIAVSNITYTNSINSESKLYKDYEGTITNTITTQDIANNTTLTVKIKNSSNTDVTSSFTIAGNTINNNIATMTINTPSTLSNGTYTVQISANGVSKSYQFLVHNPIYVTGIEASDIEIDSGNYTTIIPTITPSNAFNKNVTYKSNNTTIATVDENGVVTGVGNGTTQIIITASDSNHFSKTINVKVNGDSIILEDDSDYQITDDETDNNLGYIDNINLNYENNSLVKLNVDSFINEFSMFNAQIKNAYGELIDRNNYQNTYLGTGSQVIVGEKIYKIIITGDVNGDADINTSDAYSSILHVTDNVILNGDFLKAAEIDKDGIVTTSDAYNLILFVIGQNKSL